MTNPSEHLARHKKAEKLANAIDLACRIDVTWHGRAPEFAEQLTGTGRRSVEAFARVKRASDETWELVATMLRRRRGDVAA
jgi:hypothetical protein